MNEYPLNYQGGNMPDSIAAIPFLQNLPADLAQELLSNTTILDCETGDVIIEEGTFGDSMLFLLKGKILIEKEGTLIGATEKEGDMLGELAVLRHGQRTATLIAATHVYCLKTNSDFIDRLSPETESAYYAVLYRFLAELLARRLDEATLKLARAEQMLADARGM